MVAVHEKNIFDEMIRKLPPKVRARLNRRYSPITLTPEKVKFIDRMVADSRMVALNHTAGLSLPSQIQMMLFSAFTLLDKADSYKNVCQLIVRRRWHADAILDALVHHEISHERAALEARRLVEREKKGWLR